MSEQQKITRLGSELPKAVKTINGSEQLANRLNIIANQMFYKPPIGFIITDQSYKDSRAIYTSYRITITDLEAFFIMRNELWFIWLEWATNKQYDWLNSISGLRIANAIEAVLVDTMKHYLLGVQSLYTWDIGVPLTNEYFMHVVLQELSRTKKMHHDAVSTVTFTTNFTVDKRTLTSDPTIFNGAGKNE